MTGKAHDHFILLQQGSLNFPFWGNQTLQVYDSMVILKNFPCNVLFGLVI